MRLRDAIHHVEKRVLPQLKGTDAIAVHALLTLAKRVRRIHPQLRLVERAFSDPNEHVNQQELLK